MIRRARVRCYCSTLLAGDGGSSDEGAVADQAGLDGEKVSLDGVVVGLVDCFLDGEQGVGDLLRPAPPVGPGGDPPRPLSTLIGGTERN